MHVMLTTNSVEWHVGIINTLRCLLSVRDGCGRGCNEFAGHVQNSSRVFQFHNGHNIKSFLRYYS